MRVLPKGLVLLMALSTSLCLAQEPQPAAPDAAVEEATAEEAATPAVESAKENEEEANDAPAPLGTYRPSENISQDLGVSFPVDI
ncbi:MAG: putative flap endonuclease-1-like 5' DNA nuclease [Halieaceae bacterium]|jgi:predicted flap endonuclease-1-like 5' DNA nuclease